MGEVRPFEKRAPRGQNEKRPKSTEHGGEQQPIRLVKRAEIYYVDFEKGRGSEQGGVRPGLIVQNDIGNRYSPTTVVVPLSSQLKALHMPTHVLLGKTAGLKRESMAVVEQIRVVDKERIGQYIGHLSDFHMRQVEIAIGVLLDLAGCYPMSGS